LEFSQRLLFVTGKGGTGKSFLSSVLAVRYSQLGKKVLVVDAEATGMIAEYFENESIGYQPVEVAENIFVIQLSTDDALSEYLQLNAKIPTWAKITPLARLIDLVSNAAPGVKEILVTGKICYEAKQMLAGENDYDIIIVDAPSSGHVISLLDAPRALAELVTRGMIQTQTKWMQEILEDDEITGTLVVTTSDDVVLSETHELIANIENKTEVGIIGVVINKDIADLGSDPGKIAVEKTQNKRIDEIRQYYSSSIEKARKLANDFENFPLYAMPLIGETQSTLRSLMKNAARFTKVKNGES